MSVIPGCGPLLDPQTRFAVVVCNGCGIQKRTTRADGRDYLAWFRKRSCPPRWTTGSDERTGFIWHRCKACSEASRG